MPCLAPPRTGLESNLQRMDDDEDDEIMQFLARTNGSESESRENVQNDADVPHSCDALASSRPYPAGTGGKTRKDSDPSCNNDEKLDFSSSYTSGLDKLSEFNASMIGNQGRENQSHAPESEDINSAICEGLCLTFLVTFNESAQLMQSLVHRPPSS